MAVILGVFISFFVMFMVFIAIGSVLSSSFVESEKIQVKKNSVLVLNLEEMVKDYAPKTEDAFEKIFGLEDEVLGLNSILNAIDNAKYDDNISGISIEALNIRAGVAQVQEIREKLFEFKESGKFITAYADVYTQKNYYLSSVSDSLFVNPVGFLEFKGLGGEVLYFKDFQDKYGIRMEVVRHGKYKSAVEPFLANEMSEANREQLLSLLNSLWSELLSDMEYNRKISSEELNHIADELLARTPDLAIEHELVSGQYYKDEYMKVLKELCEIDSEKKLNAISMADYISSGKGRIRSTATDKIAVIYAQGEIKYGKGDENIIGQGLINKALEKARKAKDVKAIVFRVNSPGGSALASDIIWREVGITKKDKPVVVSMGNYATSGGYYISCNADKIYADPTTITGSIGVFGTMLNISSFTDRIGINAEQVGTNKRSMHYSLFEPMTEDYYEVTKESVENVYTAFVSKVAEGRGMSFEEVDEIAQGRIWSGVQAKEVGLVDEIGGLEDAIKEAAKLAELSDYRIRNYPNYEKEFKDYFKGPFSEAKETLIKSEIGEENLVLYKMMKQVSEWTGIQARMPYILEIN